MEEVIKKIIKNAEETSEVLNGLNGKLKNQGRLWKYFHLRPTANDVTVVSHHPIAPMRGTHRKVDELEKTLLELDGQLNTLAAEYPDEEKTYKVLADLKFERRGEQEGKELEEDIQAAFISGMVSHGAEYEGIQFLASELILQDEDVKQQNRFDVVGFKENTLYIFELKRERVTTIYEQINRYRTHFESHIQEFKKLLAAYPRTVCSEAVEIRSVKYVAVMKYAELSQYNWAEKTKNAGVDTWFFHPALAFHKLSQ